ncbi:MAG TPA: radical SAM protein [Casimicrobiaceae bacterium]|nr:radical SAM protein [Casimicrobiaceae bacterium]
MNLADSVAAPKWITFQLLERCNLRCRMCYEWGDTGAYHAHAKPAMLELPLVTRTIDECLPFKPLFEFFGGEPLLYPDIFELIQRIRAGGCDVTFPTNGTLLEARAEDLVSTAPTRLWISLDGPREVNDAQRGAGVFERVVRGIDAVASARAARNARWPELGITFVVTPANCAHVESFFLEAMDLSLLAAVSIELQSYATRDQVRGYARLLHEHFGVVATPCAEAYVRDPACFAGIDAHELARQMQAVKRACVERGIAFHSQPRTLEASDLRRYFSSQWEAMSDRKSRCAVPWIAVEVSARGDVTTCHTFYDLPLGNLHEQGLLDIWRGARVQKIQALVREQLLPVCTACCRYYGGAGVLSTRRAGHA